MVQITVSQRDFEGFYHLLNADIGYTKETWELRQIRLLVEYITNKVRDRRGVDTVFGVLMDGEPTSVQVDVPKQKLRCFRTAVDRVAVTLGISRSSESQSDAGNATLERFNAPDWFLHIQSRAATWDSETPTGSLAAFEQASEC